MEGNTRLVRIECVEERLECVGGFATSENSTAADTERWCEALVGVLSVLLDVGGCNLMLVMLCFSRGRLLIWRRNDCFLEGGMLVGGDCE